MSEVQISGRTVVIERFKLDKAMRVITLLKLIQQQAPEVSKEWARFRKDYAADYGRELPRMNAMATFGPALEHISEAEWERNDQKFLVPGQPSQAELFFAMAPVVYEKAEQVTLRLLGLIAMENELVSRYVTKGDIWDRVDELVDEVIRPAGLDEVMELVLTAAEVIDGQVLAKARTAGERAGNVLRLFGWTPKETTDSTESQTSSESPEQPSSDGSTLSPTDTTGPPKSSEVSTSTTSSDSASEPLTIA